MMRGKRQETRRGMQVLAVVAYRRRNERAMRERRRQWEAIVSVCEAAAWDWPICWDWWHIGKGR